VHPKPPANTPRIHASRDDASRDPQPLTLFQARLDEFLAEQPPADIDPKAYREWASIELIRAAVALGIPETQACTMIAQAMGEKRKQEARDDEDEHDGATA